MKKRFLACLLVLSMLLTGVGFVPAVSAAGKGDQDSVSAVWTAKDKLAPTDQEVLLTADHGVLQAEGQTLELPEGTSLYKDTDIVTVIVELEELPLLAQATEDNMELEAYAATAQGRAALENLTDAHASVKAKLQAISGSVSTQSVNGASSLEYDYTVVLNGFSMKLPYGDLAEARSIPGVKRIFVAEQYSLPETELSGESSLYMSSSTGMVGATEANALGYDGSGTIVAILDTGIDTDHEAFSVMPSETKYGKSDVAELLKQGLSCGVSQADGVYISEKIPFGYDYANGDSNPEAVGQSHGVHVAGTVAGNNGEDFFGVAPNAQLMIMKIFADNSGSASDDIILAGLDDAVKLGADSINMSLGSPAGFAEYGDEDEEEVDGHLTYYGVYTRAQAAGVSLMIAAGNETAASYMNPSGTDLTRAEYPDNGIVGSPSSLEAPMSVASVDNIGYFRNHFALGETKIPYNDAVDYSSQVATDILETLEGQTVEYVPVPGLGEETDFDGLDLTGKVALISRGTINFDVKAANAANAGAIAAIIYNNADDGLFVPSFQNKTIPMIAIAGQDAQLLLNAEVKEITFSSSYYGKAFNYGGNQISSFSSMGPAPDLSIKPEITAPGGQIYSSVIGGGYESMNGTSMATPHMAGEAAIVRQYLMETYPSLTKAQLNSLTASLLMSTAVPAVDNGSGTYFAVRRQGAGVANVLNAITSEAYLSVEGCERPKAEVGSNAVGAYTYTVTVHNLSDTPKTYTLDTAVLADTVTDAEGVSYIANSERRFSSEEALVSYTGAADGEITVPANGTATFTVSISLSASGKAYLEQNFPNGGYVEGFTFLTSEDAVDLSVPFLGFYGDWDSLTVFDDVRFGNPNMVGTALGDIDTNGNGYYLGVNSTSGFYDASRMAFAPKRANRQLVSQVSLLRNVQNLREYITDDQGNRIFDTGDLGQVRKTYAALTMSGVQYTAATYTPGWFGRLMVDGVNDTGDWAEDGKWYTYTIEAIGAASDEVETESFKFYLDNTKPTVEDVSLYEEDGKVYLTGIASDDFFVQRIRVIDSTQEYWYLAEADAFDAITETGSKTRFTFDVSGLAAELASDGKNPGRVGLLLEDVAYNSSLTFVDLGPQSMTLDSVQIDVGESKQVGVSIKPDRLSDTKLTWASQDESVATVDAKGVVTGVSDGETMISATAISGLTAYALVKVGKGSPVSLNYGEVPELNQRFETPDGFSWKVIGPDSVQLVAKRTTQYGPSYSEMAGDIVIPATVTYNEKTFRVTSIGTNAFYFNGHITSVVIPEGVKDVGYSAFFLCGSLANISLPNSLEKVDTYAFSTFTSTAFRQIPASLKWIGDYAFTGSSFSALDLPDGLTHIGSYAFQRSTVQSVSIPESVTEYGANIFLDCKNLSYVELPSNMTEIPQNMFWGTSSLKRISIPAGVTKICYGAFYGSGLEKITLPSSLKTIDSWAFAWLTNMPVINIPDSVESIGMSAFIYGRGIQTVNIGSGVQTIGKDAFHTWNVDYDEAPVMNVKTETVATALRRSGYGQEILLNGVPYTGYNGVSFTDGIFSYMPTSDTEVQVVGFNVNAPAGAYTMPAEVYCEGDDRTYTVTSVNERVFMQNQNIYELTLPDTIETVGERAFDQMFNVCKINIPKNLKTTDHQSFGYLGWDAKSTGLAFDTDQVLEIPGTLEVWASSAFSGNQHKTITIGEGVTSIGAYGLAACGNATSITLPSTLTRIDESGMAGCTALTSIDLPDALTFIGDNAFQNVPLETIDLPENLQYIGRNALGAYVYNADYTAQYWVGPKYIELNGALQNMGYDAFRPDAKITAVLNSQRNMVVAFNDLENLPTVCWDGKTDIPYNDGSQVPTDKEIRLTGDVTVDGKLTVDGKVYVPYGVKLNITEDAVIVNPENILYETCTHSETTTTVVPATCTEDGSITVTCNACGTVLSVEVIPAHCASKSFTDVNTNSWYHPYVDYVVDAGLMKGIGGNRFAPNATLTRGMLVTVLYRLAGEPGVEKLPSFTDVAGNRYYSKAIAWAEEQGIAKGMTDTAFCPELAVTREQAATFLYRYAVLFLDAKSADQSALAVYTDAGQISSFAKAALSWATAEGIFEGFPDGTLQPKGDLTRAQMAKLLTVLDQKF